MFVSGLRRRSGVPRRANPEFKRQSRLTSATRTQPLTPDEVYTGKQPPTGYPVAATMETVWPSAGAPATCRAYTTILEAMPPRMPQQRSPGVL